MNTFPLPPTTYNFGLDAPLRTQTAMTNPLNNVTSLAMPLSNTPKALLSSHDPVDCYDHNDHRIYDTNVIHVACENRLRVREGVHDQCKERPSEEYDILQYRISYRCEDCKRRYGLRRQAQRDPTRKDPA